MILFIEIVVEALRLLKLACDRLHIGTYEEQEK